MAQQAEVSNSEKLQKVTQKIQSHFNWLLQDKEFSALVNQMSQEVCRNGNSPLLFALYGCCEADSKFRVMLEDFVRKFNDEKKSRPNTSVIYDRIKHVFYHDKKVWTDVIYWLTTTRDRNSTIDALWAFKDDLDAFESMVDKIHEQIKNEAKMKLNCEQFSETVSIVSDIVSSYDP